MADSNGKIIIPAPTGPFAVGYSTLKLRDEARTDPYDGAQGKRHVTISLFYPVERSACQQTALVAYMPPMTTAVMDAGLAQYGLPETFKSIRMQVCSEASPGAYADVHKFPLVLFTPGLTFPRHQYNAMAMDLAGAGFAVATMDHDHETVIVEHPSGTFTEGRALTYWDPQNRERHEALLATRVQDVQFVLTQLGELSVVQRLVPLASGPFNTEKAAVFGHSFGGATAVSAVMQDGRFVGALNMDGSQYGPLSDTHAAVLLLGRGEPNPRNRSNNPTWEPVWQHLKGWRKEVNLKESEHTTFCDTPLLVKLSGMPMNRVLRKMVGTLEGERAFEVVMQVVKGFMGLVLKGEEGGSMLVGVDGKVPELEFGEE